MKICVPSKTKDINLKAFNMITNRNEGKTSVKQFHVIAYASSIVQLLIQIKTGIMKHVNVSVKIIVYTKRIITGILAHVVVKLTFI